MAAIGVRTLAVLFGAGFSGSYVYNHMDKARVVAARILRQVEHEVASDANATSAATAPPSASAESAQLDTLSRQLASLSQEVNRSRSDHLLIMPSYKGSLATITDIFNLVGWAVAAVSVGGVVYYVAYRKKFKLTDLAWVSQSTFQGTVDAMQKGITRVSGALGAVKRDITRRFRQMEVHVDRVQTTLGKQIEQDVGAVKDGVAEVGDEVAGVRNALGDVNQRIDQLDNKIDYATNGIVALVKALSSVAPDRIKPGSPFYDLKKFADLSDTNPANSGMLRHRLSTGGLRGLLVGEGGTEKDVANKRNSLDMKNAIVQ
ncbi:hypothetical protein BWQ96_05421 [Gracilariopsis chorda]|uniref:DUF1664 domain-containing protein n=1 Tax=Gracilariopsis chorda TaxID=448386 RepID=A0A2V3IRU4_9FLOR|nr:hypothetical protein BWQ96_05421 [Gracilariopsis chorda]|eukprot:PXF44838.1 hypothetical protein BWQ96_05421 [Gracilariopsis chorda]